MAVAPDPNIPPCCGCAVVGVVEDGAVAEGVEVEAAPNMLGGLFPGGGPAGVVEVLPNKEPAAGPGVAAALPNKLCPDFPAPPNSEPLVAV